MKLSSLKLTSKCLTYVLLLCFSINAEANKNQVFDEASFNQQSKTDKLNTLKLYAQEHYLNHPSNVIALYNQYPQKASSDENYLDYYNAITLAYLHYGNIKEATKTLKSIELKVGEYPEIYTQYLLNSAELNTYKNNYQDALQELKKALLIAQTIPNPELKIAILNQIAKIHIHKYELGTAISSLFPIFNNITIDKLYTDYSEQEIVSLLVIAEALLNMKQYEIANSVYDTCLEIASPKKHAFQFASAKLGLALSHNYLGNQKRADELLKTLLEETKSVGSYLFKINIYQKISKIYTFRDEYITAERWIDKAISLLNVLKDESSLNSSILDKALLYKKQNKLNEAQSLLSQVEINQNTPLSLKLKYDSLVSSLNGQVNNKQPVYISPNNQHTLQLQINDIYSDILKRKILKQTRATLELKRQQLFLAGSFAFLLLFTLIQIRVSKKRKKQIKEIQANLAQIHIHQEHTDSNRNIDRLTGIFNKTFMTQQLKLEIQAIKTDKSTASLIYLEIERFAGVDAQFGHLCAEVILRETAQNLLNLCRDDDILSLWGPHSYLLLMPNTKEEVAERLSKKLAKAIRLKTVEHKDTEHEIQLSYKVQQIKAYDTLSSILKHFGN